MASQPTTQPNDNPTVWHDLVLPAETLALFKQIVAAMHNAQEPEALDFLRRHSGILLFGPPGTGKTQLARALARESGVNFIGVVAADLKVYIGEMRVPVRDLFRRARDRAPCILFIDEVDDAFPQRGDSQADPFEKKVVSLALAEMERAAKNEPFIFLLAATNLPERVDEAILARLPNVIELPYPDAPQRRQILQILLGKKRVDFDVPQVVGDLATMTENFSGRALWRLVEDAMLAAVDRAVESDLVDGKITLTREDLLSKLSPKPARPNGRSHK